MDALHIQQLPERVRQAWRFEQCLVDRPAQQVWLVRRNLASHLSPSATLAVLKLRRIQRHWGRRSPPAEALIARTIRHPQLPECLEWEFLRRGRLYLIETYVDGVPLHSLAVDHSSDSPSQSLDPLLEAARIAEALHSQGWIHGDLCPRHLLADRSSGRVHLIDLGSALPIGKRSHGATTSRGSLGYAAPGRLLGERASEADDAFAWAVMAWERLTGRLPWNLQGDLSNYLLQVSGQIRWGEEVLAPPLRSILKQALSGNAEQRFTSLRDLRLAIRSAVEN